MTKVLTFKIRHHYQCRAQYLCPLFAKRLKLEHANSISLSENYASWSVIDAMRRKQEDEKTPDMLSRRLMTLNFAVIHIFTMTTSNLILDIGSILGQRDGIDCMKHILNECQKLKQRFGSE